MRPALSIAIALAACSGSTAAPPPPVAARPVLGAVVQLGELHGTGAAPLDVRRVMEVRAFSGGNAQPSLRTDGLRALGFPELYVPALSTGDIKPLSQVLDATAQTLVTHGDLTAAGELAVDLTGFDASWNGDAIRSAGGTARATWHVRWAADPDPAVTTRVLALEAADGPGIPGISALLGAYAGSRDQAPVLTASDDPELTAAAIRARDEVEALRAHFAKGIPPGEQLTVKAPFDGAGHASELMWVDVVALHGDTLEGTLASEPTEVPSLHPGSPVKVSLSTIRDYIHRHDGVETGGYAMALLKRRAAAR